MTDNKSVLCFVAFIGIVHIRLFLFAATAQGGENNSKRKGERNQSFHFHFFSSLSMVGLFLSIVTY
ncbi:hypothetical protein WKT04_01750 [Oscillospiraceae bacterium HCN-4035]